MLGIKDFIKTFYISYAQENFIRFRLGIYVPEGLRGVAHIMGYKDDRGNVEVSREKLGRRPIQYKHKYKNYKPFNPTEIKEKYLYANRKDRQKRSKRRTK